MLFSLNLTIRLLTITVFSTTLVSCGEDLSTRLVASKYVTLVSPNRGTDFQYGWEIKFSPDGETLAITELLGGITTIDAFIGVVHVYRKSIDGSGWTVQAKLNSSTAMNGNHFGAALSFSPDGRFLAVGEMRAAYQLNTAVGNVQIFDKNSNWGNVKTLLPNAPATDDLFGEALSFSPDGKILAVGAPQQNHDTVNTTVGKVDLFATANGNWAYITTLNSSNPIVTSSFGMTINFSPDNKTLALSEMHSNKLNLVNVGNVQLFSLDSNNAWVYTQTLESAIPNSNNLFGASVSFNPIDSTLAIGEIYGESIDSFDIGAVHFYVNNGTSWELTARSPVLSNVPSATQFGSIIRYSPNGEILAIGELRAIVAGHPDAGLVHLYRKTPEWQWYQTLQSDQPNTGNFFGTMFNFSPDSQTLAIGEGFADDPDKVNIGKVHLYDLNQ